MNTTTIIKNIGREAVIEPYFNVRIEAGESLELALNVAQRFLVNRADVIKIVADGASTDTQQSAPVDPAPIVAPDEASLAPVIPDASVPASPTTTPADGASTDTITPTQ